MRPMIPTLILCTLSLQLSAQEPSDAEKLFALKVSPLLQEKCLGCHGAEPDEIEGGFDLRSREALLKGGESFGEQVLVPGDGAGSALYRIVQREEDGYEMPPKESEKLSEEQTWWIRDWINGGAPWPNEERVAEIYSKYAEGITVQTSGGLSDEWTNRKYKPSDLWAYRRIDHPRVPDGVNPVDYFIDKRLAELELQPAPPADRLTLIRRATFDLLGLPPTPEEVRRFVNDSRPDSEAFAALVDRLLESPHYGEQWGRHWLDVVRYADSSGFANDWERPNAWRYRDYVIRSFNKDKPYDEFVLEQIAGDERAAARMQADNRDTPNARDTELLIAAGFLRMGPWEHTGMSVAKITRQMFLDDVTDSVGQVFLAHALQCARCHDHKFDPIPTRDYYAMQAIFATTQFAEVDTAWLPNENRSGMEDDHRYHQMKHQANRAVLAEVTQIKSRKEREWLEERGLPYKSAAEAKRKKAPPEHVPPTAELLSPDVFGRERIARKWNVRFPWEFDRYKPIAFTVYNGKTFQGKHSARLTKPSNPLAKGKLEQTAILTGGDPFAPGEPVQPGVLSAVPGALGFRVPADVTGRRTALATWLTGSQNTLTPRVMVNRIWLYHFGQAIAGNPNNFGATGRKPTHPQLLDWLATKFTSTGWSVKAMHRVVMNSEAYRRSGRHPDPKRLAEADPEGKSYAVFQPRRLAAEELRDAMLAVSGELNREIGGIPARPDMNLEAALQPRMIMGTFAPAYVPNPQPAQRNRRSIYAVKLRGHRDPFMETFNQPGTDKSCELRDTSTVSPQALTLFNGEETADRALALATAILKVAHSDEEAVRTVFRRAYGRLPSRTEFEATLKHWREMTELQNGIDYTPRDYPTQVVRRAVEENTGEPFEFKEQLFVYRDYVPDAQPEETDARTRALADVCLAVLNSNEFVYVY